MKRANLRWRCARTALVVVVTVVGAAGCVFVPVPGPGYVAGPAVVVSRPAVVVPPPVYGYRVYGWGRIR